MSDVLVEQKQSKKDREESLSGVVVYEDQMTRDRAICLCDRLVRSFWAELALDFSWWKFDYLRDRGISRLAAEAAARADLVIFSAHASRELPAQVKAWTESWLRKRENRPAALIALIGLATDPIKGLTPVHIHLREVAHRARMDYLPQVLEDVSGRIEVSVESITKQAEKVTSVLDGILHHHPIPSRWGINE